MKTKQLILKDTIVLSWEKDLNNLKITVKLETKKLITLFSKSIISKILTVDIYLLILFNEFY